MDEPRRATPARIGAISGRSAHLERIRALSAAGPHRGWFVLRGERYFYAVFMPGAGVGMGSTLSKYEAETADLWSFALWQVGVPGYQP